jgi:hypothetical protein
MVLWSHVMHATHSQIPHSMRKHETALAECIFQEKV